MIGFDVGYCDELRNAEAEKFIVLLEKTFSKHHDENISVEEEKNEGDLDCEDGVTIDFLTINKIWENILSDSQVVKQQSS